MVDTQQGYTVKMSLLVECLEAAKTFLDTYLSSPLDCIEVLSAYEEGQHKHVTIFLIKLAFQRGPDPDRFPLRQTCQVSFYLSASTVYFGSISSAMGGVRDGDSSTPIETVMERIKTWYERMELLDQPGVAGEEMKAMTPLEFADIAREEPAMDFDLDSWDFYSFVS